MNFKILKVLTPFCFLMAFFITSVKAQTFPMTNVIIHGWQKIDYLPYGVADTTLYKSVIWNASNGKLYKIGTMGVGGSVDSLFVSYCCGCTMTDGWKALEDTINIDTCYVNTIIKDSLNAHWIVLNSWVQDSANIVHWSDTTTYIATKHDLDTLSSLNYYNIRKEGAVGDGITNDLSAINAALNYRNSIFIDSGTYKITGTLNIPHDKLIVFEPEGKILGGTIIGDSTSILASPYQIFDTTCTFNGSFKCDKVYGEWFGLKGDGTNESGKLKKAIEFARLTDSKTIQISNGTFTIDSIRLYDGIKLLGSGENTTIFNCLNLYRGFIGEGSLSDSISVTGVVSNGDTLITLSSVTGLHTGDYIFIRSCDLIHENRKGEVAVINKIIGNTITTTAPIIDNYTTSIYVNKINFLKNIKLSDFTLTFKNSISNRATGILLRYILNSEINRISVDSAILNGIGFYTAYGCKINNTNVYDAVLNGYGYGIGINNGSMYNNITNCKIIRARHCLTTGQVPWMGGFDRFNEYTNLELEGLVIGYGVVVDNHPSGEMNKFSDIIIRGGDIGLNSRGSQNNYNNIDIYNSGYGITESVGDSNIFNNINIWNPTQGGILLEDSESKMKFNGVHIYAPGKIGIDIKNGEHNHQFDNIYITAKYGVIIRGNLCHDLTFNNYNFLDTNKVTKSHAFLLQSAFATYFNAKNNIKVNGGTIDCNAYGFNVSNYYKNITIENVTFNNCDDAIYTIKSQKDWNIYNNTFNNCARGLYSTSDTCFNFNINNNSFVDAKTGSASYFVVGKLYKCNISGNNIDNSIYGLGLDGNYNSVNNNNFNSNTYDYRFFTNSVGNKLTLNNYDDNIVNYQGSVANQNWLELINNTLLVDTISGNKKLFVNGTAKITDSTYISKLVTGADSTKDFIGTIDAKPIIFKTNGLEVMRIGGKGTMAGNVGIGTNTPIKKLCVSDTTVTLRLNSSKNGLWGVGQEMSALEFYSNDATGSGKAVQGKISMLSKTTAGDDFNMAISLDNGSGVLTEYMRILDNGNIGIGTTTPTSRLHVFGNGTTSNLFNLVNDKDAIKDSSIIIKANGGVILGDSSYILQSIDNPLSESRLTIVGGIPLRLLNGNNIGYTSLKWSAMTDEDTIADYAQIMGGVMRNTYGNNRGDLYFETKGSDGMNTRMYIDSSGYVGIGTTTPKYRLDIGEGGTEAIRNEILRINSADNNELSNSIILLARGDTTRTTIATSSTNNLFITGSKENDLCIKTESNNILFSANDDDELDIKIDTNGNLNIYEEIIWRDGVGDYVKGTTLSDNEAFEFPTGYSWKGEIDVDSLGFTLFTAQLRCDATGTPYLEGVSWKRWSSKTYVKMGSEDGYFNVIDGVGRMIITNTLGYTIAATLRFRTKP